MGLICALGNFSRDFFGLLGDLPLVSGESISRISCADCVLVLGQSFSENSPPAVGEVRGIVASEDYCGEIPRGVQLITCGFSHKNAVSITSRTEERLTLSLNRSLRARSGVIEPLELPVPAAADEYELMAAFAARLLLS